MDIARVVISYLKLDQLIPFCRENNVSRDLKFKYDVTEEYECDHLGFVLGYFSNMIVCGVCIGECSLAKLVDLRSVVINCADNINIIPVIIRGRILNMIVGECNRWKNCEKLVGFINLRELKLRGCRKLIDITGCAQSLERISLVSCWIMQDVRGFADFKNLTHVNLCGCDNLTDLSGFAGCVNLRRLHLTLCLGLIDVSCLENCKSLKTFIMIACGKIQDMNVMGCERLRRIVVICCNKLVKILCPIGLRYLTVKGCDNVEVEHFGLMRLRRFIKN